jgi:hypothetical protein
MEPLFGTGRGLTTDNFFMSVPTAEFLLQKNITMTGTLRAKKSDIPAMMEAAKGRDLLSPKFIFSDGLAVVSYVPKKNKTVCVLSTQFLDDSVSDESHIKPSMILEDNRTKGEVDNADKLVREYSCARCTSRWPLRLFMNDIGALIAFIIWMLKKQRLEPKQAKSQISIPIGVGQGTNKPNILRRASNPNGLQLPVVRAIEVAGVYVACNTAAQSTPSTLGQQQSHKRGSTEL